MSLVGAGLLPLNTARTFFGEAMFKVGDEVYFEGDGSEPAGYGVVVKIDEGTYPIVTFIGYRNITFTQDGKRLYYYGKVGLRKVTPLEREML